jgi:hypothetical protein
MQIFIISKNPKTAARMLCDKHIIKMILESCQILSTCHHLYNSKYVNKIYKKTHINHPCVLWVCKSKSNYQWLVEHLKELFKEYFFRYNKKEHKSYKIFKYLKNAPENLEDLALTKFAKVVPDKFRKYSIVKSYRTFYIEKKLEFCKWTKRKRPKWLDYKIYKI